MTTGSNYPPIVRFSSQSVATLSTSPVVVAPLVEVSDPDSVDNEENLILLNFTQPVHGVLSFLSCCNTLNGSDAKSYFYGSYNRQVADYRSAHLGPRRPLQDIRQDRSLLMPVQCIDDMMCLGR